MYRIKVICSYCKKDLGFKDWDYDPKGGHTDGVCDECCEKLEKEIEKKEKDKKI